MWDDLKKSVSNRKEKKERKKMKEQGVQFVSLEKTDRQEYPWDAQQVAR